MSKKGQTNRREVLLATLGAGIAASAASGGSEIPYRVLGRTGEKVSCIGMGGYHLGKKEVTEGDALTLVRTGVDRGINFLDNSWDYNKERARRGLGKR
jgi:hypothetical protein